MDSLRPADWDDYVGQTKLKNRLKVHINGALDRMEQLEHIILVGPPGCGKTSLGALIAQEASMDFVSFVMPLKPNILRAVIEDFQGVAFLDEFHRIPNKEQEQFLPFIEDGYWQMPDGSRITNPDITIVAATTERDQIIKPLWDRFEIKPSYDTYTDREMAAILRRMAEKSNIEVPQDQALILARATGGVPRNAKSFVRMAVDLQSSDASAILEVCRITPDGLGLDHLAYLEAVVNAGGVCGLDLITSQVDYPKSIVLEVEKLLVKRRYIKREKAGRTATAKANKLINKKQKWINP